MAFRMDEAENRGLEKAKNFLIPLSFSPLERQKAEQCLQAIMGKIGFAIDHYPSWHPILSNQSTGSHETYPSERTGYSGLDHTQYFSHGFITCPYQGGEEVIKSAEKIICPPGVSIVAEKLDVSFYATGTESILVYCQWDVELEPPNLIPKALAIPMMLEKELPMWRHSKSPESWETMRPYILGAPHGQRSSLFISQDTALALKKAYLGMVESGMFSVLS